MNADSQLNYRLKQCKEAVDKAIQNQNSDNPDAWWEQANVFYRDIKEQGPKLPAAEQKPFLDFIAQWDAKIAQGACRAVRTRVLRRVDDDLSSAEREAKEGGGYRFESRMETIDRSLAGLDGMPCFDAAMKARYTAAVARVRKLAGTK